MNENEMRIEIAKLCGIKDIQSAWAYGKDGSLPLPDYFNDLNAIHDAEMMLFKTPTERCNYLCCLENVSSRTRRVSEDNTIDPVTQWACFATAPQRAEALLRTI